MDGRKRLKSDGMPQTSSTSALKAVEQLIAKLHSCMSTAENNASSSGASPELDGLVGEFLLLQEKLHGTVAQQILDQVVHDILRKLEETTEALQTVVDKYIPPDGYCPPVAGDEQYVRDIIAYAHKLSYTTFAPMGFVPGQTALRHFKPPAPQDFELRSSQLHQFQRKYDALQHAAKQAATAAAAAPVLDAAASAQAAPAGAVTDFDQLFKELGLPKMPEGWKPGDPIPGALAAATGKAAAPSVAAQMEAADQQPSSEEEEEEEPAATMPAIQRPQLVSAFNLALNPEYEMVFGGDSSDSDDDSEEESA